MTASAPQDGLAPHTTPAGYAALVERLGRRRPREDLVPARVLRAVLTKALGDAALVAQARQALFEGRDGASLAAFREVVRLTCELRPSAGYPAGDLAAGLDRLHAALGLRAEADALLRHELTLLNHGTVAPADLIETAGDLGWSAQLYLNALSVSAETVVRRNVAKLLRRFEGFCVDAGAAQDPDETAAREPSPA